MCNKNQHLKTGNFISCKYCGKEFYVQKYLLNNGRKKFCSKECFYKGRELKCLFEKNHKDFVPKESRFHTKETKQKISKSALNKNNASSNHVYIYGKSGISKQIRRLAQYFEWRTFCFKRDLYTCQQCGKNGVYLIVHHIKSFISIIRENNINTTLDASKCDVLWDVNNGITLCKDCHSKTDNYKHRAITKKIKVK